MRHLLYTTLLVFTLSVSSKATPIPPDTMGLRSDTINVLNYTLYLNFTNLAVDTLKGNTIVRFTPKMSNIKTLCLDLEHMTVDSIVMNNTHLTFTYISPLITLNLPLTMNVGDTGNVRVYYHGRPVLDPVNFGGVRWGGFYDTLGYAFNLGVGFSAIPHNFGRAWYPCFDNFIAKSTFTFHILSDSVDLSFCNGAMTQDSVAGGKRWRTWVMNHPISSYHACVDVAPYTTILDTFRGIDTIPIVIASEPGDTANVRLSFAHLHNAIAIFQNCYGRYRWNKVGYSLVPFNDGAMEHASNIAYPLICANGSLTYEADIMAHELSHHWCGDLVTCSTAEDMWLNEGFAVFNQSIFEEYVYGEDTYHTYTRANHDNVVHYCAIADHGYWALNKMPQPYTYGNLNYWVSTTYQKGADVMYTLRNYMGDSAFFNGMKYYFGTHMYQPVSSDTLMHSLERSSGQNLTNFFNDWVKAPGFPQFSVDSMTTRFVNPNYVVTVYVKQKLMGAPAYYTNVPIDFTFKSSAWATNTQNVLVSGHLSNYVFTVPFKPVFCGLDMKGKLAQAISSDTVIVRNVGTYNKVNSRIDLGVTSITDSAYLFFEHNYAAPDTLGTGAQHFRISPYRYWKISGVIPSNFKATTKLYYDGTKGAVTSGKCYLDTNLCIHTSDSLILLYRPNAGTGWKEFKYYTKTPIGPHTNHYGYMTLDSVYLGEYTFANGKSTVLQDVQNIEDGGEGMKLYPNPSTEGFTVEVEPSQTKMIVEVYNVQGKRMKQITVNPGQKLCTISTADWSSGNYMVTLSSSTKKIASKQMVVTH
jgi:hypothetical protein